MQFLCSAASHHLCLLSAAAGPVTLPKTLGSEQIKVTWDDKLKNSLKVFSSNKGFLTYIQEKIWTRRQLCIVW